MHLSFFKIQVILHTNSYNKRNINNKHFFNTHYYWCISYNTLPSFDEAQLDLAYTLTSANPATRQYNNIQISLHTSSWQPTSLATNNKQQTQTQVLLRTPITQMIFFNQGMLLLGSNHFLINKHKLDNKS